MKKFQKNKKGFTLIEMVLVIAIIVILASVLIISIGTYLAKANTAKLKVSQHNASVYAASNAINSAIVANP